MNPRHTRRLMFVLLVALMVVVVVAAIVDRADAATGRPVVTIDDPRITESSGLALSRSTPGLAYTVNDSGHAADVFAIELSTGAVVGVTTVRARLRDVEALALRDGTLWIGDVGDNAGERDDVALLAIDEPGRSSGSVDARRYPIRLAQGSVDVEALLAPPGSDRLVVVTKALAGAQAQVVRERDLGDRPATLAPVTGGLPALVTDGAVSPDGSRAVLLTYGALWTLDASDWSVLGRQDLPRLEQPETVAFVDDATVLVGSEGEESPLHRLTLAPDGTDAAGPATIARDAPTTPGAAAQTRTARASDGAGGRDVAVLTAGAALAVVLVGAVTAWWRLRSRAAGSRRAIR